VAPGSGDSDDDDPALEARAYNENIYLMVAAPYVLLGVFGFLIYRGFRRLQQAADLHADPGAEAGADGLPASTKPA
jgi:hypothetical protein